MTPGTKVSLGILGGVAIGGIGGYFFWRSATGKKVLREAEKTPLRLPQPSYAMEIAYLPEHFDLIEKYICEIGSEVLADFKEGDDGEAAVKEIQNRIAKKIYPDFPWPAMSGDHPTVGMFYNDLAFAIRQALARDTLCKTEQDDAPTT